MNGENMSNYNDFAYVYDRLMSDVDYNKRTEYLLRLFEKYGKKPTLLLDLACGTGGFSIPMAKKGIEVIGVDMSEDMLCLARENSINADTSILFLCQKAEELDLYGTVDGAICCLDSLNHITDINLLKKAIEKVSLFLEKDCLFIFDLNTQYKHKYVLADNTFIIEEDNIYCIWQNKYNESLNSTNITLDFFVKNCDNSYSRSGEDFFERAYSKEEIEAILKDCGLELLAVFDDMTENPLTESSERAIFVTKKKG